MSRERHLSVDELLVRLWSNVPLTPELFEEHGGYLVGLFSVDGDPATGLHYFMTFMASISTTSKEAAAMAAVFGANSPMGVPLDDMSIDGRLSDAATAYGDKSSRSARRWARKAVETLSAHLETAFIGGGRHDFVVNIKRVDGPTVVSVSYVAGLDASLPYVVVLNGSLLPVALNDDGVQIARGTVEDLESLVVRWFSASYDVTVGVEVMAETAEVNFMAGQVTVHPI